MRRRRGTTSTRHDAESSYDEDKSTFFSTSATVADDKCTFFLLCFFARPTFEDIYCVVNQNCGNRKFYDAIESYIPLLFFRVNEDIFFSSHTIKIGNDDINGALVRMAEDLTNFLLFPQPIHTPCMLAMLPEKPENSKSLGVFSFRCSRRVSFSFNSERSFPTVEKFQLFSSLNAALKLFIISQQCSGR